MTAVVLVIPCYNEAERLPVAAFEAHAIAHPDHRLVFVNDGSRDDTLGVVRGLAARHGTMDVCDLAQNAGKAEAVRRGMLHALEVEAPYYGFWDADLATPLTEVVPFLEVAHGRDAACVVGSRIRRMGARIDRLWYRHYLGRGFATAASLLLGLPTYDTQCGAKIFSRSVANRVFREPFASRWLFDVELFFRMKALPDAVDERMIEHPLSQWRDVGGSKIRLSAFAKAPFELLALYLKYRGRTAQ